jgi:release factor glutamine methyltransferase
VTKKQIPNVFQFKELTLELDSNVYEPAEDTFLLLDALSFTAGISVLELGGGCGLIALAGAQAGANVVCTDKNLYAIKLIKRNYERNKHLLKGSFDLRQGDLFSVLKKTENFDRIVFNPPYLPTKKHEHVDHWFDMATDGGPNGLTVTKRFITGVKTHLKKQGKVYFVFSSLSPRAELENHLRKKDFSFHIIKSQQFENETLDIYCLYSDTLK